MAAHISRENRMNRGSSETAEFAVNFGHSEVDLVGKTMQLSLRAPHLHTPANNCRLVLDIYLPVLF